MYWKEEELKAKAEAKKAEAKKAEAKAKKAEAKKAEINPNIFWETAENQKLIKNAVARLGYTKDSLPISQRGKVITLIEKGGI